MIGWVWGPMTRSIPSLMSGLPARPMPAIRPSLMPMSALTTRTIGSTTTTPAITASSSDGAAGRGRLVLGHPRPEVLGITPDRLVALRLPVGRDADPEVGVAQPDAIAGRWSVAGQPLLGGEAAHRPVPGLLPLAVRRPRRPRTGRA